MKKLLLLFLGTACGSVMFAQGVAKSNKLTGQSGSRSAASDKVVTAQATTNSAPSLANKKTRQTLESFQSTFGVKQIVGRSTYDLQSNGSMQRRVLQNGNTISCAWTYSNETPANSQAAFADRGTGYAYFDGTSWSAEPSARLENIRTGFGGFAGTGGSSEMYIAHDANAFNYIMSKKTAGTWTQSQLTTSNLEKAIWPHSAASGNWLYVVGSSNDSLIKSNGIRNGVFFSRSNDGGASWIDNQIPFPLLDSVNMYRAGGNSYAISAHGNRVAVLFGDVGSDLTLVYSDNNGATWTKQVLFDWPIDNYNFSGEVSTDTNNDLIPDTLWTNDGSHTMTISASNKIHVAFPVVRVYKVGGAGNAGYNFFYDSRLLYWNEDMAADSIQELDGIFRLWHDCSGDSVFGLGGNYVGDAATDPDAIYNTIGTLTMPTISVSAAPEKVFIAYTTLMDNDTTTDAPGPNDWSGTSGYLNGQNFRDVMVVASDDNAASWTVPVNISRTGHFEETFPTMAENFTGNKLAVLYQADKEPGTLLQNEDIFDPYYKNIMVCHVLDIDSLINTLGVDPDAPCYQFELPLGTTTLAQAEGTISVYPNPVNDVVNVNVNLLSTSKQVVCQITDMTGRTVYSSTTANASSFHKAISLSGLASGNYVVHIRTDKGTYTEKIVKE